MSFAVGINVYAVREFGENQPLSLEKIVLRTAEFRSKSVSAVVLSLLPNPPEAKVPLGILY